MGAVTLNRGSAPTFRTCRASSTIDISFASPSAHQLCADWRIHNEPSLSDHAAIRFNISCQPPPSVRERNFRKADWTKFASLLTEWPAPPAFWNKETVESQCDILYTKINAALDITCPKRVIKNRIKLPWWKTNLDTTRREATKAHHINIKQPSEQNTARYKTARRAHYRAIRTAKRESWKTFVSGTEDQKNSALLSKIVQNKLTKATTNFIKKPNGSYTTNSSDTAKTLLDEHFPDNTTDPNPQPYQRPQLLTPLPWITDTLIKQSFSSFLKFKAAGPDELKPVVLQHLPLPAIQYIRHIYTACLNTGYTPSHWSTSKAIFIPKPGKPDYQDPRAYRPISLTPFLFKTLEKLMLWQANETCLKDFPLHDNQHAFRQNHSCDIALSRVVNEIEKSITNQSFTLGVFLDIQGAFDNITTQAITAGMIKHGFPPNMITWYTNYIKNRSCFTKLGNACLTIYLHKGTPQGGVFSPIAWNLAFDDLLSAFDDDPTLAIGFADDGSLLISGPDHFTLANLAQTSINKAVAWGKLRGLSFSHSKTTAILFHRKYSHPEKHLPKLHINNKPIEYKETVKYLGITLDRKLSFTQHIKDKFASARKSLLLHRAAMGVMWGPAPHLVKWLFEGMIRPAFSYGCHIWGRVTSSKGFQEKARKLHRLALLPMSPVRSKCPTAGLEIIAGLLPLELYIEKTSIQTYLRIQHLLPNWDGIGRGNLRGHIFWLKKLTLPLNLPNTNLQDKINPITSPTLNCPCNMEDFQTPTTNQQNTILIYTDGSKTNHGLGAGVAIFQADSNNKFQPIITKSYHLPAYSTVFQAEVEAINHGAILALEITNKTTNNLNKYGDLSHHTFHFISDSKASLQAVHKRTTDSKTVLTCINNLKILQTHNPIDLNWIKAHNNHHGNELADLLAKKGTTITTTPHGFPPNIHPNNIHTPYPKPYIRNLINQDINKKWNQKWHKFKEYRQTKIFFPTTAPTKSLSLLRLDRDSFGRAARWLTGHCFLNRHKNLLDPLKYSNQTCRLCEMADETPSHIICDCEALGHLRHYHFLEFLLNIPPEWKVPHLIQFLRHPLINNLETNPRD